MCRTENLDEMVDGIKNVAAHLDKPEQDQLLEATRRLCKALRDLLDGAQPGEAVSTSCEQQANWSI